MDGTKHVFDFSISEVNFWQSFNIIVSFLATAVELAIVKELDSQEVMETEEATFTIELNKPDQKVVWYHKGKKVAGDKYVTSSEGNVYKLVIKGCTLDDTAEVKFTVDKLKPTAKLTVKGTKGNHLLSMGYVE